MLLDARFGADALAELDTFSHALVLFFMHQIDEAAIVTGARYPRGNHAWPKVGIFAQRGSPRPNRIGATVCEILRVADRRVDLRGLDAIDGTPVLDIKPWLVEMGPRGPVRQPAWASEIMKAYW